MRYYINLHLVFILFIAAQNIYSQPVIIYDSGNTIDAQQFYPFEKPQINDILLPEVNIPPQNRFPIITKEMSVGKINTKTIKYNIPKPICIIGYDDTSKYWLQQNSKILTKLGALCFVVNVSTKKQLAELQNLINVNMQAVLGSDFAKYLNIKHYPLLIYNKKVQQ